jgi:hypothetical protein
LETSVAVELPAGADATIEYAVATDTDSDC